MNTATDNASLNLPSALDRFDEIAGRLAGRRAALFFDYDGTLTPIVQRPEHAVLTDAMRARLERLAEHCTVAVVTGRDLENIRERVELEALYYAGSHGFDIAGPQGLRVQREEGVELLSELDAAESALRERLAPIAGSLIERKKFAIAVHYRQVADEDVEEVKKIVANVAREYPALRRGYGKKIVELQPDVDWHKGRAVQWLLRTLALDRPEVVPIYVGDDLTDEDAFRVLRENGIGIVVLDHARPTLAHYRLQDTEEVERFLEALGQRLEACDE